MQSMLSVYNIKHLGWESPNISLDHYDLFCDTTDDLPDDPYYFSSETKGRFRIAQGSIAWIINTADVYIYNSSGEWILGNSTPIEPGGSTVKITTIAGASVKLSNQSKTYTAFANSSGIAEFTGVAIGTYTVTATIDDAESDSTTIIVSDFTATEDSFATLTLSASDNTTITLTDGTTTKTLNYTGTPIIQYVSLGTWDLSCIIDATLITRTVSVSTYTNQDITLSPPIPSVTVTREVDFVNNISTLDGDVNTLNVYSNMKRCNVADDGTINAYDGDVGYTENGSNGQVMVKVNKFYYKLDVSQTGDLDGVNIRKGRWSISDTPDTGFKLHPAFLAADGVTELDYFLYGAFEAVGQDSNGDYSTSYNTTTYKLGSVGGNTYGPTVNLTRATARTMATNRGTGWYNAGVKQTMALQMLFAVEYGFNSQKTLGWGIVSASAASNTGTTTGSISSGDLVGKTTAVNWRGIENFWGNVFNWIDGLNINNRVLYVCDTFTFVDDTSTGYTQIAFTLPASSLISALGYDTNNDWIMLPSEAINATVDSTIGDYVDSGSGWRVARVGGSYGHGSNAGALCWYCNNGPSYAGGIIGARVMYLPIS